MTDKAYKLEDWQSLLKASRTTIWRMIKQKELPQPDIVIGKSPRWFPQTVNGYLSTIIILVNSDD